MGLWRAFLCFWRHLTVKGLLHLDFFLVQQPLLLPVSCGKKCYGEILRDGICVDFALYVINGADEMIQSLYDNAALQDISAIKNKKVISLDFNAIYGGSGDLYTAMSDLADEFYGA